MKLLGSIFLRKYTSVESLTLLDSRGHMRFCCVRLIPVLSMLKAGDDVLCTVKPGLCIQFRYALIYIGAVKSARARWFKLRPENARTHLLEMFWPESDP